MSVLDFIVSNYVYILLIIAILIAIFLSGFKNTKKSNIHFVFILISFVFTIFHYVYTKSNYQKGLIGICIFMELAIFIFSYYIISIKTKNHIIYTIPLALSIPFLIIFKSNILIAFITCFAYLSLLLIRSIFKLKLKKENGGLLLIICVATSYISLFLDYYTKDYSLLNLTLLLSAIVFFVRYFVRKENEEKVNKEKYIQNQKTSLAISQIQPHFLYNSLATIGYLCKNDPKTASLAIDKFSDYLRANLNSISQMNNVPFAEELKHVETYLWLEKLRFEDRLQIKYDIQINDFLVPALSIQPIVENAVKHGLCNKIGGGTITIRTIGYNECIKIVIEDDGVGFNMNQEKKNDGRTHVGIENVKSRISSMADGNLEVLSTIDKGTIVTITIPRR